MGELYNVLITSQQGYYKKKNQTEAVFLEQLEQCHWKAPQSYTACLGQEANAVAVEVLTARAGGDLMHAGTEERERSNKNLPYPPRSIIYQVLLTFNTFPCCLFLPLP